MHFSQIIAASLAAVPTFVAAHAEGAGPKLFGLNAIKDLKVRNAFQTIQKRSQQVDALRKRQVGGVDGQCGAGVGSCASGYCCSAAGWCGTGTDYCAAPDAQYQYGSGADTLVVPPGSSTESVARTKVGSVAYGGEGLYSCSVTGTIALTYDDGPYDYTSHVLDLLDQYGAKATFFITGNNLGKGRIDDSSKPWPALIQRMYNSGHQVASHTWGHQDLSAVDDTTRKNQMIYNEMAFRNILGVIPTYMRPPYSSCTAKCQTLLKTLGYHIVYFDVDTEDYLNTTPDKAQTPKNNFKGNITQGTYQNSQWLEIAHDIHYQTAYNLTEYMLQTLTSLNYKAVTVGDCQGDPKANWYRSAGGAASSSAHPSSASTLVPSAGASSVQSSTVASPTVKVVSPDGTCGGANGYVCTGSEFGGCCSQAGWCGSTSDYCVNCQSAFGCSASTSTAPAPSATATKIISTDGSCGGSNGFTCVGSSFGDCCSQYGWCGSTADYCTNCQSAFGCGANAASSSAKASAPSATPASSSATPASSSATPASSSTVPASSNAAPASSSVKSASSNAAPASSSVKSVSSNVTPLSSSAKPASSSAKPASSSTKPASSSAKPASSSVKAATSSVKTVTSSSKITTTAKPTSSTKSSSSAKATTTTKKQTCFPFIGCL